MTATEVPLIRTKLAPPRMGTAPVSRDLLLEQLDAQRDRKLILVQGPAGSGKTTLLAQWRKQLFLKGAAVAWYYASTDDNDIGIATYIVESLRQAGVALDTQGLHVYARSGGKSVNALLASLVNALADHPADVYLIIDDFHCVSSYSMLQLIDRWLVLMPPQLHIVLGSRVRPPLALDRLRAESQLSELRFGELRFDLAETMRFLEAQGLGKLNPAQVRALHEMTDGWAAGLQILAYSLRKHATPEGFFDRQRKLNLSQEDALRGYLEKSVVEHLSEDELDFLTRISACRRFNRELCELLTGNPRAGEYLDRFVADNLFLIPIDTPDAEPWYRFHRMFAGFLNAQLARYEEGAARKLHQLASHWFAGKSLHVEALRHAEKASDTDFAVELVDRAARGLINSTAFQQLLDLCDRLPRERLRVRLNVLLCAAWAQLSCSRMDDFDRTMDDIAQHPSRNRAEVRLEVQLLKAYCHMRKDDTTAQLKIVEPMLQDEPPANAFHRLLLYAIAGLGLVYANRFEEAREAGRKHRSADGRDRRSHPAPFVEVVQGFSHLMQGNLNLAAELLQQVLDDNARDTMDADAPGVIVGYLIEARYQLDDLPAARRLLERYQELIDAVATADGVLHAARRRARIEQVDGNHAAARKTLLQLEETGLRRGLDRIVAWSLYEQALLCLGRNEMGPVGELLRRLDTLAARYRDARDCAWSEIPLVALIARADAAMHGDDHGAALAAIDAARTAADASGRQVVVARLGFLRAIVLLRAGQTGAAREAGLATLALAVQLGMRRALIDLGAHAQALIGLLLQADPGANGASYLKAAQRGEAAADAPPAATEAGDGDAVLSTREREVLDLLSRALSIKSIARGLNISPGTVKWHLKNIYGKLGAVSREDALAKSRTMRIIQ